LNENSLVPEVIIQSEGVKVSNSITNMNMKSDKYAILSPDALIKVEYNIDSNENSNSTSSEVLDVKSTNTMNTGISFISLVVIGFLFKIKRYIKR
jgi:hypothetical protein